MARPGKLLKQFEELKKKQSEYMRTGRALQAMQLAPKIAAIKNELLEIDRREEERKYNEKVALRDLLPKDEVERNNIHKKLVKISLAADFLYDCLFDLECALNKMGILVNSLSDETNACCQSANTLASKLIIDKAPKLASVVLDDEPMVDQLHAIIDKYIEQTLLHI